jgi:NTE family protein
MGLAVAATTKAHGNEVLTSSCESSVADQVLASSANWSDGLAHPIPYANPPGRGKQKGLALGGGGLILMAWYVGFFTSLKDEGVNLGDADIVVGTSAGALFGAMLMNGNIWRMRDEMDLFSEFPKMLGMLLPEHTKNPSQTRASDLALTAKDASSWTIQSIGHAAATARNDPNSSELPGVVEKLIGMTDWASPKLYTTSNDCYTGQRLVVSHEAGIPMNVACGASCSLPGGLGPTFLKDRICMDGGICQTSTHSDVIGGVKKAIILSLGHGTPNDVTQGLRTSSLPNILFDEIKRLEASGTQTMLVAVGLVPGMTHVQSIMDPALIGPYLEYGRQRGRAQAKEIGQFWG